jgi:hypothetical protein
VPHRGLKQIVLLLGPLRELLFLLLLRSGDLL